MNDPVKINFRLQKDEDGYPDVSVESVWARSGVGIGEYILDNIPFFVRVATIGDAVAAYEENGQLWFDRVTARSSNSLLRVIFFDRDCKPRIARELASAGCEVEFFDAYNLLAISIPANVNLSEIQAYLKRQVAAGFIDYEEPILRQSPAKS
jgi:hypothetical protein